MDEGAPPKKVFQLGLTMAGAVSAGAYSAGVLDFLIEALDQWHKAKAGELPGVEAAQVPRHDVLLSVISGASAGGVTGALAMLAMSGGIRPTEDKASNPSQNWPVRRALPAGF